MKTQIIFGNEKKSRAPASRFASSIQKLAFVLGAYAALKKLAYGRN
jgi:hypothetical protein